MNEVVCNRGCERSWPRDPALEVACPLCSAKIGQLCKRPSGHTVWAKQVHPKRDILADQLGFYGKCPLGLCGLNRQVKQAELPL